MFSQVFGVIAEFEQVLMSERTMDGLAAIRARTGGQKPKLGPRPGQTRPRPLVPAYLAAAAKVGADTS
ncbi:recombinase family protein (plasmid) [Streptomyces sp. NBC_01340]|uniref:hypothetical protein n=1 Tax=unclassified Streptomyces TaxID=2593676 RepID=UPI00225BA423|nr:MULTISPECIES: hypothetical protein [unclassified Streptomyces]MCX4460418.1 recombinase family protein [Streptomyces sp. NBC_01719]MCX4500252.1 recombinase family protein [Streptomyces sp. NBC_01728]MCX4597980.1 recombinase family protein [Streptomyces sp. NBC_01549]WSI45319.1 recombinase family protein [Streptomyces sp. NBC_01340]